jgi:hypothetical protein
LFGLKDRYLVHHHSKNKGIIKEKVFEWENLNANEEVIKIDFLEKLKGEYEEYEKYLVENNEDKENLQDNENIESHLVSQY